MAKRDSLQRLTTKGFYLMSRVLLLACLIPLTGCGKPQYTRVDDSAKSASPVSPEPKAPAPLVVVVVDSSASDVVDKLQKAGFNISPSLDDQESSALVIVVQNSSAGTVPEHADIAKRLLERDERHFLWLFSNTSLIEDSELLELEELECRELFNSHGLPGDDVTIVFDSVDAPLSPDDDRPKGWDAINEYINTLVGK